MNAQSLAATEGGKNCRKCGAPLALDTRHGFCPACLFTHVLAIPAQGSDEISDRFSTDSSEEVVEPLAGGTLNGRRFGDYELLRELGRGGMGIVYQARQTSLGRMVAVKLLRFGPLAGDEFVKRLRLEATAAGCLRHPHIVAIHEVGIHHDQHFLVMDFVAGPNLATLAGNQPLAPRRAASLVKSVAEAIHYAHERGILHRDLKPSNILMDEEDQPHITDFGLAKRLSVDRSSGDSDPSSGFGDQFSSLTLTGQVIGSPNYMPPEQASANKGKVGRPSDVYSLGAILYQLLTGRPPFLGETLTATLHQVLETEPASPRLLSPNVPADLETICLKCLEKEPERRYATAREFAEELGRFLSGDPILACPIGVPQRIWRWSRKHGVLASLIAATFALLLTVAIGSPIAAYRIHRAREDVERERQDTERERQRAVRGEADARSQLYAVNMNQVQAAWEANHFARLTELLGEGRGFANRNFEWFFWQRQMHLALTRLRGHSGPVVSAAFSPDGHWVATGSEDHTARIWAAPSGRELVVLPHKGRVRSVAWFPDNRRIVSGSDDHTVKIWSAPDGMELVTLRANRGRVLSVAVSADGQWFATAHQDGTATVWAGTGGQEVLVLKGHAAEVWSVAFSPDGASLVTGSADHTGRVWDRASGRTVVILQGHPKEVRTAAFSPDGQRIITASEDYTAMVWEASSGRILRPLAGHADIVQAAVFSPDGRWIATASNDWAAKLWRASDGHEFLSLNIHDQQVYSIGFSPDSRRLVTGSRDWIARLWKLGNELEHVRLETHHGSVWSISFSPDGRLLATAGDDRTVRIWDAAGGRQLHLLAGHKSTVRSAVFMPDGRRIATAGEDGTIRLWSISDASEPLIFGNPSMSVLSLAVSPDGQRIITGAQDGKIQVWDTNGVERLTWDGHVNEVRSMAFSPNGERIVTGSLDETVKVWETASGRELLVLTNHSDSVLSVAFSPDGRRVVSGSEDRTAKVWDAGSGRELLTLRGHAGSVFSVAFSPDGERIVSGSDTKAAKLWDAKNGGQLLAFPTTVAGVRAVAFSRDGLRIGIATRDGTTTVWESASAEQAAMWENQEKQAGERVARFQRERLAAAEQQRKVRASDPGAIRQWLVLAPVPYGPGQSGREALDQEFCSRENELCPKPGDQVRFGEMELTWRSVQLGHYAIDFAQLLGRTTERSVAYAVCYIQAGSEQNGLRLLVGSDDQAKIYLNGRQVYKSAFQRGFREDEDAVEDIHLKAGVNVLVFKVININADWMGSVRLTDAGGSPVKGIKVSAAP